MESGRRRADPFPCNRDVRSSRDCLRRSLPATCFCWPLRELYPAVFREAVGLRDDCLGPGVTPGSHRSPAFSDVVKPQSLSVMKQVCSRYLFASGRFEDEPGCVFTLLGAVARRDTHPTSGQGRGAKRCHAVFSVARTMPPLLVPKNPLPLCGLRSLLTGRPRRFVYSLCPLFSSWSAAEQIPSS